MILIDTNVLVALTNRRDKNHKRCTEWYNQNTAPLLLPSPVVAEACYLIEKYGKSEKEALFLDDIGTGPSAPYRLAELQDSDLRRMAQLVRQYDNLPLGCTDAALVAIAERLGITTLATMDNHFRIVKPRHTEAFSLVPN